jgi:hypothetical protein
METAEEGEEGERKGGEEEGERGRGRKGDQEEGKPK